MAHAGLCVACPGVKARLYTSMMTIPRQQARCRLKLTAITATPMTSTRRRPSRWRRRRQILGGGFGRSRQICMALPGRVRPAMVAGGWSDKRGILLVWMPARGVARATSQTRASHRLATGQPQDSDKSAAKDFSVRPDHLFPFLVLLLPTGRQNFGYRPDRFAPRHRKQMEARPRTMRDSVNGHRG